MKYFKFVPEGTADCMVRAWIHENEGPVIGQDIYPAVILCPGGAYQVVSGTEGDPVAKHYFAAGYHVFILEYAVGENARDFNPLCQLASTIAHIRKYASELYVQKEKIAVCGFSAGGHLAASLGTLYDNMKFLDVFGREEDIRPDAMILCYPVITADEFAHVESICNVSGAEEGTAEYLWFGLDQHVDKHTPPTFLWHTAEDDSVPVENSLKMAAALSAAKVPFEMHIFPEGAHGASVCSHESLGYSLYNARWIGWSIQWLNQLFEFEI